MSDQPLEATLTVADVLARWPETVTVFQELQTACVGCAMAPFDTIEDVARIYEFELSLIMGKLEETIADGGAAGAEQSEQEDAA